MALDDGKGHGLLLSTFTHQTFRDEFSPGTPLVGDVARAWAMPLLYHIPSRNGYSTTSVLRREGLSEWTTMFAIADQR